MTTTPTKDIVDLLQSDHEQAKTLLNRFDATGPHDREQYFCEVVNELVKHEVAEEVVVYPVIREEAPDGEREADARIKEQSEAEQMLSDMEKLDATSSEFEQKFKELRAAVLGHAMAEEENVFPLLRALERSEERRELGERYEKAKATAPSHPHPHAPDTPPGNVVLGPVAAVFDKARDALKGA